MFTHSCLSFSVSLSFRAIHIQYNNPYKHLFLFMSLSSSLCSSTHENVNTENGFPWGGFMHHTCEQKVHAHLPDSAFVRAPHCHPRTSYYIHISVTFTRSAFSENLWTCPCSDYFKSVILLNATSTKYLIH